MMKGYIKFKPDEETIKCLKAYVEDVQTFESKYKETYTTGWWIFKTTKTRFTRTKMPPFCKLFMYEGNAHVTSYDYDRVYSIIIQIFEYDEVLIDNEAFKSIKLIKEYYNVS